MSHNRQILVWAGGAVLAGLLIGSAFVVPGSTRGNAERSMITNSIGMKLVVIPSSRFLMGSPEEENERGKDEAQRQAEITKPFYLGVHEVTQGQFQKVMGYNPSYFSKFGKGHEGGKYVQMPGGGKDRVNGENPDDFPVENVSWEEVRTFLGRLSGLPEESAAGRKYRLPTEAEWESSCRGGSVDYQSFHFGNSLSPKQANFDGNLPYRAEKGRYLDRPCKVGSFEPNAFGLFDMHGNVAEWCSDWYGPYVKQRVIRGGSWYDDAGRCRSAARFSQGTEVRDSNLGFRVAADRPTLAQPPIISPDADEAPAWIWRLVFFSGVGALLIGGMVAWRLLAASRVTRTKQPLKNIGWSKIGRVQCFIVYADLAGFTRLTERRQARHGLDGSADLSRQLYDYWDTAWGWMSSRHTGGMLEYDRAGDGVLLFFEDVCDAFAYVEKLNDLARRRDRTEFDLDGEIHTFRSSIIEGWVLVDRSLRVNGSAKNVASRYLHAANPCECLIDAATFDGAVAARLPLVDSFALEETFEDKYEVSYRARRAVFR